MINGHAMRMSSRQPPKGWPSVPEGCIDSEIYAQCRGDGT
jgi:hypothetical protein